LECQRRRGIDEQVQDIESSLPRPHVGQHDLAMVVNRDPTACLDIPLAVEVIEQDKREAISGELHIQYKTVDMLRG